MNKDKRNCASCGAEIFWVVTASGGKPMPVNITPVVGGNIAIQDGKAHYISKEAREANPDTKFYTSHFSDCPQKDKWRKK